MSLYRIGFWTLAAYLMVDFGQVHQIIPGLKYMLPGALTEGLLFLLVLAELPRTLNAPGGGWFRPILLWQVLFLGSVALGLVFAVTQGRALMVLKTEVPRFLTGFLGILIFLRRIEDLRILQNLFIGAALLISGWCILHSGHGPGLYKDENDAALVLVMLLPFSFLKFFGESGRRRSLWPLGVFFITLVAIGLTLSRGGMVGVIPALVFCWLKSKNKAVGLALAGVALLGALLFMPADFKTEFKSIGDTEEGTAEARRYYWDLSVMMFEKRPVVGVGAMSWGNALYSGLLKISDRRAHMTPHSIYFQLLSELGLVGVFCWMGFLTATFRELRGLRGSKLQREAGMAYGSGTGPLTGPDPSEMRRISEDIQYMRHFAAALAIGIVGYLISGAFLSVLFYPGIVFFAAMVQATGSIWRTRILMLYVARLRGESHADATAPDPSPAWPDAVTA